MNLIKKIIASAVILLGVACAGIIICLGVMIVFPEVKIFGVSWLNTTSRSDNEDIINLSDYANLTNYSSDETAPTILIDAKNFNVNVQYQTRKEIADINHTKQKFQINTIYRNHVMGFTTSSDSNKTAKMTINYDEINNVLSFVITEPNGFFINRDTFLTIAIPQKFDVICGGENRNINFNLQTQTNNGLTTLGTTEEDSLLKINNLSCSCTGTKGSIAFKKCDIINNLKIKNVLGRITVESNISGNVEIDSKLGSYEFQDVGNLLVDKNSVEGQSNAPSVTIKTANSVNYKAESGLLNVTCINNNLDVKTSAATIDIKTVKGTATVSIQDGRLNINQLGYETSSNVEKSNLESTTGNLTINKSYYGLVLSTTNGKITAKECYREVSAMSVYGPINIEFYDETLLKSSLLSPNNDFINNKFCSYLDEFVSGAYDSLEIQTTEGAVTVKNIRNSANIQTESSQLSLHFLRVIKENKIKTTSKSLTIKVAASNPFVLNATTNLKSNASFKVNFGDLIFNSWPKNEELSERVIITESQNTKTATFLLNTAAQNCENVINLTNNIGAITFSKAE